MAKAIREASFRQEMINYISKNAGWLSPSIFPLVDWAARANAGTKIRREQRLTVTKLEFGLFATRSRMFRFEKTGSHQCPRCNADFEQFDHVITCREASNDTMATWTQSRKSIMTRQSCPFVLDTFEGGILQWISGDLVSWQGIIPPKSEIIGKTTYEAFNAQQLIGWHQAVRGRISHVWGKANNIYLQQRFNHKSHSDRINLRASNTIYVLWQFSILRWRDRNDFIYGATAEEKLRHNHSQINILVSQIFMEAKAKVMPANLHLFDVPLTERLNHTLDQKRRWTESVQAAIQAASLDFESANLQSTSPPRQSPRIPIREGRRPRARLRT